VGRESDILSTGTKTGPNLNMAGRHKKHQRPSKKHGGPGGRGKVRGKVGIRSAFAGNGAPLGLATSTEGYRRGGNLRQVKGVLSDYII